MAFWEALLACTSPRITHYCRQASSAGRHLIKQNLRLSLKVIGLIEEVEGFIREVEGFSSFIGRNKIITIILSGWKFFIDFKRKEK